METAGVYAPESTDTARERYAALEQTAEETVRAATRAMGFDSTEFERRVTDTVYRSAQDALFANLLAVRVGTRDEFDSWRGSYDGNVTMLGSDNVDNVVWHAGPNGTAVAATFQDERNAAVATLRRRAFGSIYDEVVR